MEANMCIKQMFFTLITIMVLMLLLLSSRVLVEQRSRLEINSFIFSNSIDKINISNKTTPESLYEHVKPHLQCIAILLKICAVILAAAILIPNHSNSNRNCYCYCTIPNPTIIILCHVILYDNDYY